MWINTAMAGAGIWAISGLPALATGRRSWLGQWAATALGLVGSALGLSAAGALLGGVDHSSYVVPGPVSALALHWRLDALAGFFLVPVFLVGAMGAVYGLGYWRQGRHPRTGQKLRLFYGLLVAALAGVVLAGDAVAFLLAWEVMALSAYFLMGTEDQKPQVRQSAWQYLVATHVGTLSLIATFALWHRAAGSFELNPLLAGQAPAALRSAIFVTAMVGFGLKAGMMPLHFWLPGAHANAPSHVSAILSGVLIKMGIYGLVRVTMLMPGPPMSWGGAVLGLGTISAVLGVVFALGQHDLKRLLAYHSIENIGIILMGLGLALLGEARGRPEWVVLGLAGCLLHVWNHALFKSLLFLAAGSVIHATGTRQIDRMGGLAKRMPQTAVLFMVGAIAISGLPPLNGFVSELLVYIGLFKTVAASSAAAVAAPALAMVGALAVACFVKAFGAVFLGEAREKLRTAHEAPWTMRAPMGVLAVCCGLIGLVPVAVMPPLQAAVSQWAGAGSKSMHDMADVARAGSPVGSASADRLLSVRTTNNWSAEADPTADRTGDRASTGEPRLRDLVPAGKLTAFTLVLGVALLAAVMWSWRRGQGQRMAGTWDCGYARPTARMQYTSASFARTLVEMFRGVLRPREHEPQIQELFPSEAHFHSHVDDVVLDEVLFPVWRWFRAWLGGLRIVQRGSTQAYVLYILIILLALLALTMPLRDVFRSLLGGGAP